MMNDSLERLDILEESVAKIAGADSPSEVFRSLLDGSRGSAPRACILLARGGLYKGWGCSGYPADAARRFRSVEASADSPWIRSILAGSGAPLPGADTREGLGDFGQPPASECSGVAIRIGGRPVALLVAERTAGESPWEPVPLRILGQAARLRLELDLAWRRLRPGAPSPAPSVEEGPANHEEPEPVAAPAPVAETTALEAVESPDPRTRALDDARRFARLVATEIRLYNEEDVVLGRRHRDLEQRLSDSLEQGRSTFQRRFPELGDDGARVLQEAYVQVLAGGDDTLLPRS